MAFTGDSLLICGCGRTDFQQGSAAQLFNSVQAQILSLPDTCLLFPAHDHQGITVTSVLEEKRFNPRLGRHANEADFTGYMKHLGLPHPKLMDSAVPANLRCGEPISGDLPTDMPAWAPLTHTFSGVWEIEPMNLLARLHKVQVVDVREAQEFTDAAGHVPGARLLPSSQLTARIGEIAMSRPVVAVCRSGTRSAQATVLLKKAGFEEVANMAGGMLRWQAESLPVGYGDPLEAEGRPRSYLFDETACLINLPLCVPRKGNCRWAAQDSRLG